VLKVPLSASKRVDFAMGSRTVKTMLMRLLLVVSIKIIAEKIQQRRSFSFQIIFLQLLHVVAFWHVSTTAKVHWKEAPVLAQKEKRFLLMEGHAKVKMSKKSVFHFDHVFLTK
jgi:hypothetical protein